MSMTSDGASSCGLEHGFQTLGGKGSFLPSLKDGAFYSSVPITILGRQDPHRLQGEHPLLVSLTPPPSET